MSNSVVCIWCDSLVLFWCVCFLYIDSVESGEVLGWVYLGCWIRFYGLCLVVLFFFDLDCLLVCGLLDLIYGRYGICGGEDVLWFSV